VTAPSLGIVVPTLDRRESVLRLLRALESQTAAATDFEVVVVVDGSTDGTAEAVDAYRAPYALHRLSQQRSGSAAARNAGARAISAPIVHFLDDDMEPSPGMVAAHLERHRRGDAFGVVGAVPIVVPPDAPPIVRYRARVFGRKLDRLTDRRDELAFNDVYAGNVSLGRETFLAEGGYDETFRAYGNEDYELSLRLGRAGHRFVFEPDALAQQHYDKTLRQLAADVVSEGRSAVAFARKHPEVLPALPLGGFRRRRRSVRARLALLARLEDLIGGIGERLLSNVERADLAAPASGDAARFARYDSLFDILYWLGAERELRTPATPWWDVAITRVDRWIRDAGGQSG
jgi:GT2 family glycosyltransferase